MSKTIQYKTQNTCSRAISVELDEDDVIKSVTFSGGCMGNTQGVAALVRGMKAQDAIERLEGIRCGFRPTSCPDQLAQALKSALGR
ncbi:MAG: TIGR03905 family TSCPD domain-containing protein [Clostridia bacterium]|nr:TIGR03905 family TSCPD domain-containing protein [Clostridia bacterium]